MPSKFDRLRLGEVVEIEPGRKGRLNLENKSFETSDGRSVYVGDDVDFFPPDEEALAYSREKERLKKEIKSTPGGEFLYQFGNQGVAGAAKDWMNKFIQKGDEYQRTKRIGQEVSEEISETSPWTSRAATVASFAPDFALTKGMGAFKAAPTLTALHAGPRIIEDPAQVAGEAALSAAGGFLIDKGANALSKIAQRRGLARDLPGQQAQVREQNLLGKQAVNEANIAQSQQFNALKQNIKGINDARLIQHQAEMNAYKTRMINDQNAFEKAKLSRETEIIRLKNEAEMAKAERSANRVKAENDYKAAKKAADAEDKLFAEKFKLEQKAYQDKLSQLPELQKQAQAEYSANVVRNSKQLEKNFPKNSKFSTDDLDVDTFIEDSIRKTGIAGTREANQSSRILKSLFPEGEILGGRELSKRYQALEEAIQRSTPEVQSILNNFKNHLGQSLPSIAEDSVAYSRIAPLLRRSIESDIRSIMKEVGFVGKGSDRINDIITKTAISNAKNLLNAGITPKNFIESIQSGEFARNLSNKILTSEDFLTDIGEKTAKNLQKQGIFSLIFKESEKKHAYFVQELNRRLENKLAKYEIKALQSARNTSQKLGENLKKTYGLAEPVESPLPPSAPLPSPRPIAPEIPAEIPPFQMPPPVSPPETAIPPFKPTLIAEPSPPIPQSFIPQPEPNLMPPQGGSERIGDLLEKNLMGGKGMIDNPITKLAGLKYLLGKAALPIESGYVGMKALTSPTSVGKAARISFKQGGIQAIDSWARRYPSYHDGILENPQERRSLTKEIEDDFEIPLEQKAIFQSKINRGKPIQGDL